MTEAARPARRKRPHVAAGARVVVVGAATAGTLAMVGLMADPATEATAEPASAPAAVSFTAAAATPPPAPTRIVVVRRHHPAPTGSVAAVPAARPSVTGAVAPAPAVPVPAPAIAPAPAPRPAAPTTTSRGS